MSAGEVPLSVWFMLYGLWGLAFASAAAALLGLALSVAFFPAPRESLWLAGPAAAAGLLLLAGAWLTGEPWSAWLIVPTIAAVAGAWSVLRYRRTRRAAWRARLDPSR